MRVTTPGGIGPGEGVVDEVLPSDHGVPLCEDVMLNATSECGLGPTDHILQ